MDNRFKPLKRPAERAAKCRACDKDIQQGEEMITWWSCRNRGMYIHLCLDCCKKIGEMSNKENHE